MSPPMSTAALAQSLYGTPKQEIATSRGTEYRAFARMTAQLAEQVAKPDGQDFPGMVRALHDNQRMWMTLAADVAEDGNRLPAQLRAQIFYLAEFTRAHTRQVLARTAGPDILVEINTALMRGLRADAGAGA